MPTKKFFISTLLLALVFCEIFFVVFKFNVFKRAFSFLAQSPNMFSASIAAIVKSPFLYSFTSDGILNEVGNIDGSTSPYWWLSSGGKMVLLGGLGMTVQGELPATDKWRLAYAASNPVDTDNGYHPQNIFRMVTRSTWQNFTQQAYFLINKDNLSDSPNRNASNGILFFNRYQDSQNLYYTGIRVDGYAVIKKKINGTYYTLAYNRFINGVYNKNTSPNLLPKNIWIGLKSEVKTDANGSVNIKVYVDQGKTGNWVLVAQATDNGKKTGGAVIGNEGYTGFRTDFMDVKFDNYKIENITG